MMKTMTMRRGRRSRRRRPREILPATILRKSKQMLRFKQRMMTTLSRIRSSMR